MFRSHPLGLAALALVAASLGSGCSDSSGPGAIPWALLAPKPPPAPTANSPQNAARLVEWCWTRLDTTSYRTVFADDYLFVFAALDPYGNAYRDTAWTRTDERISFHHLVAGGEASQPRATFATCIFDRNFRVSNDPRPGKTSPWHELIRTSITLHVTTEVDEQSITGYANFFLVRGDSAAVGVRDSTRWYVERWEDDTFSDLGARTMPTKKATWGSLKVLYR